MSFWDSITGGISDAFSKEGQFGHFWPSGSIGGGNYSIGWGLPVIGTGLNLYEQWQRRRQEKSIEDALRQQAEEEWARGQNNYNAYQDYIGQYYNGSPTSEVVPNEELLSKIPELQAIMEAGKAEAVETLRPFREINEAVAPKMLKAYARGLKRIPQMTRAVFSPTAMELLGASTSPMKQDLGLSQFLRSK
jgi:hypothetical protein